MSLPYEGRFERGRSCSGAVERWYEADYWRMGAAFLSALAALRSWYRGALLAGEHAVGATETLGASAFFLMTVVCVLAARVSRDSSAFEALCP
jgi:hypothetical protein